MTPSSSALAAEPRRGRAYPWIFVAAFLGIIAVNATMVALAVTTFSGIETPKHYLEGLAYNQLLAATRAQEALGWHVDIAAAGAAGDLAIAVAARDAAGRPLEQLALEAILVRPTRSGLDRQVALVPVGPGRYRATASLPEPGLWDLRLIANRGEAHWQTVKRLMLP